MLSDTILSISTCDDWWGGCAPIGIAVIAIGVVAFIVLAKISVKEKP